MGVPRPLKLESLSVEVPCVDRLVLNGTLADPESQARLDRYLEVVHGHIVAARLQEFAVNVHGLTFVNSSAIRLFVNWISKAQRENYKLVFEVDRSITWHRLSFSVLKSLAPQHVEVNEASASRAG